MLNIVAVIWYQSFNTYAAHGPSVLSAAALTVAVFRSFPQQRQHIMDEVLTTVIANITVVGSRGPVRLLEATDADVRPMPIMMATALIMQLVEVGEPTGPKHWPCGNHDNLGLRAPQHCGHRHCALTGVQVVMRY